MTNETISSLDRLQAVLQQKFEIEPVDARPDAVLEALDLDSLALVELSLSLQKAYGLVLPTDDVRPTDTIADLAKLLDAAAHA